MVRRDAAQKAGGFDSELRVGEDCDYWMSILACGAKLAYTRKRTCFYTKHAASAMSKTLMVAEHGVKFYRKHLQSAFLPEALRKRQYSGSLVNYGRLSQRENPVFARSLFLEAWSVQPLDWRCPVFAAAAQLRSLLGWLKSLF